jgi:hypothetical protein
MVRASTLIPEHLRPEFEPFWRNWELAKDSQGDALDRDIREAGWNFFFLAGHIQETAWGRLGEECTRRALKRALARARASNFNCLQVTELTAGRFLGLSYVRISAHPRHIQKGPLLQPLEERGWTRLSTWAHGGAAPARQRSAA